VAVSAGYLRSMALDSAGHVYHWGGKTGLHSVFFSLV
jgi:hypothetical protein